VGSAGRLHALWLDVEGAVWIRSTACALDGVCNTWSDARRVNVLGPSRALHAIAATEVASERLALAALDDREISLRILDLEADREALPPTDAVKLSDTRAWDALALSWGALAERRFGVERALVLVARASDTGELVQWMLRPDGSGLSQRAVVDADGQPIRSGGAPSLLELPTGELCGVFPDPEKLIRIYVYQPEHDNWLDLTAHAFDAALGPRSTATPHAARCI
jgi:hypothetical protein